MTNRDKAREMKRNGKTYQQIGDELGVSRQRAQQLLAPSKIEREELSARANGKCEKCGAESDKLDSHHESYEGAPTIMLCTSCHIATHATGVVIRKKKEINRKTINHANRFPIQAVVYVNESQARFLRNTDNASAWVREKIDNELARIARQQRRAAAKSEVTK